MIAPGGAVLRRPYVTALLLATVTLAAIFCVVRLGLDPDQYFFQRAEDWAGWVFQPAGVAWVCVLMLAEAVLVGAALISPRPGRLWLRCAMGATLLVPWALLSTMIVVHAPGYVLFHHLWVWALATCLVLVALASGIRAIICPPRPDTESACPPPSRDH